MMMRYQPLRLRVGVVVPLPCSDHRSAVDTFAARFTAESRRWRCRELVTLAVVFVAAVVVWRWVSRRRYHWKQQERHDTADARSVDEDDDLESRGDDVVNPEGSDINSVASAGADFLSTRGDIESRRSDIESGSSGVQSREAIGAAGDSSLSGEEKESASERSSCDTSATVRTHHPDDTDSGSLGSEISAAATAAQAEAGSLPSDRNGSRFSTEEAQPSTGTNSPAMAMRKESSRHSSQLEFDVLHHGSSGNSSNNSVYSRDGERSGDRDGGELGGHSVNHDVLADALHGSRIAAGEREGQLERSVTHGELERSSGSVYGHDDQGASTEGSGGGASLSTITEDSYENEDGDQEEEEKEGAEEKDQEYDEGGEDEDGNVGDYSMPSSHGSMPELVNENEVEPHLTQTRTNRLVEIFRNAPLMSTAVRDIYIARRCDLDLSATDSNDDLSRERVIGAGYYGRVSRVYHESLGEALALKELSEEAGDEHRSAARNEMDTFLSLGMHPNITKVLAINSALPSMPILMELGYCDMVDVLESPDVSMPHKMGILYDAACGLAHIHDHNMVHRDIKAANIVVMVNEDGSASGKVADFGLTCEKGEVTPSRTGTPGYIPSELVWSAVEAGPENDVFSFGVLMLEVFIQPDLWEQNMFVHRFLLSDDEKADFADLGGGNVAGILDLQFEVMARTLGDGSFGREIMQPENLAASVPYRYAVCGWLQACLCQPRDLRPSMASLVNMLKCLKEGREPPPMAMLLYM
ncbi:similar to doublecortin and CaM kinase-like 3 [Ectocarpus siliculosus]|uniref:Similar to doublecortin and CaM kinase-like 3 n=1 Tax=Ectocarpus siliculosus TaxID=2880 RepID=D8LJ48_ECTSI|nr:similar to doublecortin and CaM kinase-like 3 [Ectocarpus siliculosus]|eukprot:CBN76932.1 similar to doublecortin and CaM kinase-like 3 [Ectocarpus siliculosus]